MNLREKADQIRVETFSVLHRAGGGHYGGCMSCVEILTVLYYDLLRFDPHHRDDPARDRFILAKGHSGPTLYTILADLDCFDKSLLAQLDQNGGALPKHVDRMKVPGIEYSSGPLGQGLSVAAGMAVGLRDSGYARSKVYCLLGDGELDEGQIWEAAMCAAHYKIDNLIAIVDWNHQQIDGPVEKVMSLDPLDKKWEAFGWNVIAVDGHNVEALAAAFRTAHTCSGKPSVLLADTIKGKGISFMEGNYRWHSGYTTEDQYKTGIADLTAGRSLA